MSNWQEVQKAMREAKTPQEKQEALRMLNEHIPQGMQNTSMVTMAKNSNANVVNLRDIKNQGQNPEIYERLKKMVGNK